jgi:integrase
MSSIFLKDGMFWYQRYVKNPKRGKNDKRIQRSLRTKNRAEAELRQTNFDKRYDDIYTRNSLFPPRPLSKCIKEYLREKKIQVDAYKRSLNTYRSDDISLNQFLAFMEDAYDDLDIREINKKHILQFKEYREDDKRVKSTSTVSLNLRVTRSFFSNCIEKEYIEEHPFKYIKIKKSRNRESWPIGEDFDNLFEIFRELVERPFPKQKIKTGGKFKKKEDKQWLYEHEWFPYAIFIILNTGCRIGEILMLKWKQGETDYMNKELSYSFSYLSDDFKLLSIYFKRGYRELPIKHLKPTFKKVPKTYLVKDGEKEISRKKLFVFENKRTGGAYLTTTAANLWKKFLRDFNLNENWTIHSLRHGVASALLNSGRTHFEAGQILGHSTTEMISRYGHGTIKNKEDSMSVLHRPKKKKKKRKKKPVQQP